MCLSLTKPLIVSTIVPFSTITVQKRSGVLLPLARCIVQWSHSVTAWKAFFSTVQASRDVTSPGLCQTRIGARYAEMKDETITSWDAIWAWRPAAQYSFC